MSIAKTGLLPWNNSGKSFIQIQPSQPPADLYRHWEYLTGTYEDLAKVTTTVVAPAGYGKTTLLSCWAMHCAEIGIPCAWISFISDRDDLIDFLTHLKKSVAAVIPEFDIPFFDANAKSEFDLSELSFRICLAIGKTGRELVIIFDGFEKVNNGAIIDLLQEMQNQRSEQLKLVFASRQDLPFDFTLLKAYRAIRLIEKRELSLTVKSLSHLLSRDRGLDISHDLLRRIHEKTSGWFMFVNLLAEEMEKHRDDPAILEEIVRDSHSIKSFLADNLLSNLTEEEIHPLVTTAVLDWIEEDYCAYVCGRDFGGFYRPLLEKCGLASLLLSYDDHRYRYHQLLKDLLNSYLENHFPRELSALHFKSAEWLCGKGYPEEALPHLFRVGRHLEAFAIVTKCAGVMMMTGRYGHFIRIYDQLPMLKVIERYIGFTHFRSSHKDSWGTASLRFIFLLACVYRGDFATARKKISPADRDLPCRLPGCESLGIDSVELLIRLFQSQDVPSLVTDITDYLKGKSPAPYWYSSSLTGYLFTHALQRGDFNTANRLLLDYRDVPEEVLGPAAIVRLKVMSAQKEFYAGNIHTAYGILNETLSKFERTTGRYSSLTIQVATVFAETLYQMDFLDDLEEELSDRLTSYEASRPEIHGLNRVYGTAIKAAHFISGHSDAESYYMRGLEAARAFARNGEMNKAFDIRMSCTHEMIRICLLREEIGKAGNLLTGLRDYLTLFRQDKNEIFSFRRFCYLLTAALVAKGKGRNRSATRALDKLACLARQSGLPLFEIQAALPLIALHYENSDLKLAFRHLDRVLTLCLQGDIFRPLVEMGPPFAKLLSSYVEKNPLAPRDTITLIERVLARMHQHWPMSLAAAAPIKCRIAGREEVVESLTNREREILSLLAGGHSNKAIAKKLEIAASTVKWNLKNIYGKLMVTNRTQATIKAQKLFGQNAAIYGMNDSR